MKKFVFCMALYSTLCCGAAQKSITDLFTRCEEPCHASFDLQFQAGGVPTKWFGCSTLSVVNCPPVVPDTPITPALTLPGFECVFETPWTVGGQLGYSYSDHVRFFFEGNYTQTHQKTNLRLPVEASAGVPAGTTITVKTNHYRLSDFYLGTHYSFPCLHDYIAPFFGAKIGILHRQATCFSLKEDTPGSPTITLIPESAPETLIKDENSVSGGIQAGIAFNLTKHFTILFTAEAIANPGPQLNTIVTLAPDVPLTTTNLVITPLNAELRFPLTAGIRYYF